MDFTKNSNYLEYQNNLEKEINQKNILDNNYTHLKEKNYEIKSLIRQFQTLDSAYRDETTIVTANYYNYIVYLFVSVLLILLFLRFSEKQTGGGGIRQPNIDFKKIILFFIMILFFMIIKNYNNLNN